MNEMTHYIFVTMKKPKTGMGFKTLVLAGIGYAVWSEINRQRQEGKIDQLTFRLNKLEHGEGE